MMFTGHHLVKICNGDWVFDMTEFKGYKVKLDTDGSVKDYKLAFDADMYADKIEFNKYMKVPVKVIRESSDVIWNYNKEACIEDEQC